MSNFIPNILRQGLLLMALLGTLLLQTSCVGINNSLNQYPGEVLYETAMESGDGLLSLVPDLQADVQKHLKNEKQEQAFQAFQQSFMRRLIEENSSFADEFYDSMHSNDRQRINEALADAGEIMERELQKLVGDKDLTAENVVNVVLSQEG